MPDDWRDQVYEDDADRRRRAGRGYARRRVSAPAVVLVLFGALGLFVEAAYGTIAVTRPTAAYDWYVDFVSNTFKGPQRDAMLKSLAAQKDQMRMDHPVTFVAIAVGGAVNLVMIVGGLTMRRLGGSGYTLALHGGAAALAPVSGCACFAVPVGIWALAALSDTAVRHALSRPPADR